MTVRLLSWACIAVLILSISLFDGKALVKGDAAFIDVRTKLAKDRSGKKGDPKDKYFRKFFTATLETAALIVISADESTYVLTRPLFELLLT